ncbi:ADP-ribosylglycohydrolase family protein [Homoserinimonas sp. OAct 916]|uniref:ADP-ribosylglycohydrolase family protein n=1 Tax=Homoserinimonas sp. OAct 916 TaxID=2211450 RepID=UPI000DBE4568|nr:ADP-ribosylglycohydrolase family protein [Homoserinimonas sp. OAct 916]
MTTNKLNFDRAAGTLLGLACGDALGAGYEFGPPLEPATPVTMKGGGGFGWAPAEWTDDTSMAVPIARAAAEGLDLQEEAVLDRIVADWAAWVADAPDVGIQTRGVLRGLGADTSAVAARAAARRAHDAHGRSGGNGSLMRTAPVALAYLGDPDGLVEAACAVSDLTHFEPDNGDACVLWCLAIRHAVRGGGLDVRVGLDRLPADRRVLWEERIAEAEQKRPRDFDRNGWVVQAFQAAWSAIVHTDQTDASHFRLALEAAVRGGRDADTVAAIAGSLLGAHWGASAVPAAWSRILQGWPGLRADDLVRLAVLCATGGKSDQQNWPAGERLDYSGYGDIGVLARHPHDDGVWLGAVGVLDDLPAEVDAVVSLCRLGSGQVPERIRDKVSVWLIDASHPAKNPNLDFLLTDAADAVAALRGEGRTVLLHCVQAQSRTPTVAALYSVRHLRVSAEKALSDVKRALPRSRPQDIFNEAVRAQGRSGL